MAAKARTLTTTRQKKVRPRWVRMTKRFFAFGFLLFLIGFTVFGFFFVKEMRHASELMVTLPEKLRQYSQEPTRIISRNGKLLYSVQSEFRDPIKYEDIPKHVRDAIVAAEDKRYFDHSGVDYWAMGRILVVGAKEGRLSQGGSTLTMQLAKRFYSEGEKTFSRKMQDVALAITMERDMSKEQILTLYLNTMYFGERAYGIQAASEVYFGKTVDKISIAEAAMLARCVRRPSDVNPVRNLEASIDNRNTVLGVMRDEHMITESQYQDALDEPVKIAPRKDRITSKLHRAPYFVDHVLKQLEADFPDIDFKAGGYTVYTTLDTELQDFADRKVNEFLKEHRRWDVNAACFVLTNKDGQILCEVGGQDYDKSQFNIVTQGLLQPGSSFKSFLYSTALSTGAISANDYLENTPFAYDMGPGAKPWTPKNSSRRENQRSVSVDTAFTLSYNIPAARVIEKTGPENVKSMATTVFGLKSLRRSKYAPPSMALGSLEVHPLEMAEGYSVFMLHGDRATPYCITKVVGPDGNIVRSYSPRIFKNQLDPWVVEQMDNLLHGVVTHGTANREVEGYLPDARGKTGTTTENKDAWFCGYNQGVVAISWCGNMTIRKGQVYQLPMASHMYGGTAAAKFWRDIVKHAIAKGFGSKIPELEKQAEPVQEETTPDSETRVKVIHPGDEDVPTQDGTTGGDAPPTLDPGQTTGTTGTAGTTGGEQTPPVTTPPDTTSEPPVRRDPPRRNEEDGRETQVEICAESGMRATIYCPETVTRSFRKGKEPRRRCSIHGG